MPELTKLILENERLIYKCASYFPQYQDKDDLYQAGCQGMKEAYDRYDPSFEVKFTTYAYSYIIGQMKKLVREDKGLKVSRDISRLRGKIEEQSALLSQKLMREPTTYELSVYLDIPEYCIIEALNSNVVIKSIDSNVGDTNMQLHEVISSPNIDMNTLICLRTELENLQEPERTIMIQRYYEDQTQTEIANQLGLSQVDVSRREKRVLTKLRQTIN